MIEEKSAGVVIFRDEPKKYLLLNYPTGHWDFVKGKIEKDETKHQTVLREALEETGINDLEFVKDFEHTIRYDFKHEGVHIHKQVVFFLARTRTDHIKLSHEHLDYTWLDFEQALKKITFENARSVLKNAVNHLSSS